MVGFQGETGAFSEEAALLLLGAVETRGFRTFDALVEAVAAQHVTYGLLPCENTITGSIARAYDLLSAHPTVRIVDETTHVIDQCLIGTSDATIERLTRVASHPVALEQCREFFARHPHLRVEAAEDTAGSVRAVAEACDPCYGAIGPATAALRYGATVVESGIQDNVDNLTRFFLITARTSGTGLRTTTRRACIAVTLENRPGRLHNALGVIAQHGLDVRSLVVRPSRRRPFEYIFYLELHMPPDFDVEALALIIDPNARVLGRY